MSDEARRKGEIVWQDPMRRDDHRLQLLLLESLSRLQDLTQDLDRFGWMQGGLDRDELVAFQQAALEFLFNLDPTELGDYEVDPGKPIQGQGSLFDLPDS